MIQKTKNILLWMLLIAYFPVIFAFANESRKQVACSDIHVLVKDSLESGFVSSRQIRSLLIKQYPDILGNKIEMVDCEEIEVFVNKHQAIKTCEAYYTVGGNLNVVLHQRRPLCRVFSGFDSFYIDEDGRKMPVFTKYTAHVLVISGHINKLDSLNGVIELARYINENEFWNAQIEQVYVQDKDEFTLAPRVGDQIIHLGKLDNFERKMENLYALYTNGLHPREWNNYSEINLKFEGQIICTKK